MQANYVIKKKPFFQFFRADSVIGGNVDHDDYTNHEVEFHSIFGNNFGLKSLPKHGPAFTSVEKNKIRQDKGTFDVIFYLVATLFKASLGMFMSSIIFFKLGQFKDQNDIYTIFVYSRSTVWYCYDLG